MFAIEPAGSEVTVYSRMFAPGLGVAEDPATGGASGPLGCYLVKHGLVPRARCGTWSACRAWRWAARAAFTCGSPQTARRDHARAGRRKGGAGGRAERWRSNPYVRAIEPLNVPAVSRRQPTLVQPVACRVEQAIVQAALAALPELDRAPASRDSRPRRRHAAHRRRRICAVSVVERLLRASRAIGIGWLCGETHAPIWLSSGREWK